ncbi:calcium-binding protein [Salipiger mucosus]|uniref:Alkaline phosphatase n=1 Tax=Salipiger mucosus DSM 16094 TaxID=1123237 RepID=S9RWL7_9RHOB|nr:calcium-binding protein [Salipiger mucosus]EPX82425.1 Alkaline phosphatase [Salipiger mucosus DSM 16094]
MPGGGNDRVILSNATPSSYYQLDYSTIATPISVTVNTPANTATITGSGAGTDTIVDIARPVGDGFGGLEIMGTTAGDTFDVTTSTDDFIGVNPGAGNDVINATLAEYSNLRITYDWVGQSAGASTGIVANLNTGIVSQDGYGGRDTINATGEGRIELQGTDYADRMTGSNGDDRFITRNGNDTVDGLGGRDLVRYDRRQVDQVNVNLTEGEAVGSWDGVTFVDTLASIEDARGSRDGNDILIGSLADNRLEGRGGNDTLEGRGGEDQLLGGIGNDLYVVDGSEAEGVVRIFDDGGVNILRLLDGPGPDAEDFYINDAGDLIRTSYHGHVTEIYGGTDSVQYVQWSNADQSTVAPRQLIITDMGDAVNSAYAFVGTRQNDSVVAADVSGSVEAEIYVSAGDDSVTASDNHTAYTFLGTGNDSFTGGTAADWVRGQEGNDLMDAGAGNDTLWGEDGNDTLLGGAGNDLLYAHGSGADVIDGGAGVDWLDYNMADGRVLVDLQQDVSGQAYARFFTQGAASGDTFAGIENVMGGAFADNLRGDAGTNVLEGGGVSDRLYGRAGDDVLMGGTGADALYGNLGADTMTGGDDEGRRDRYIYFQTEESGTGAGNRDIITDFVAGEDRIELSRFDADTTQGFKQAFDFIGDDAFSAAGQLGYRHEGGNTIVQADFDGDGAADFEIELTGVMDLTEADFLI